MNVKKTMLTAGITMAVFGMTMTGSASANHSNSTDYYKQYRDTDRSSYRDYYRDTNDRYGHYNIDIDHNEYYPNDYRENRYRSYNRNGYYSNDFNDDRFENRFHDYEDSYRSYNSERMRDYYRDKHYKKSKRHGEEKFKNVHRDEERFFKDDHRFTRDDHGFMRDFFSNSHRFFDNHDFFSDNHRFTDNHRNDSRYKDHMRDWKKRYYEKYRDHEYNY